jgi:hypothetical protein
MPPRIRYAGAVRVQDDVIQPVYAGTERHACNPFCRAGQHAELLYREEPDRPSIALAQAVTDLVMPGRRVLDVQSAPEAPLPAGFRTAWLVTYGPREQGQQ